MVVERLDWVDRVIPFGACEELRSISVKADTDRTRRCGRSASQK